MEVLDKGVIHDPAGMERDGARFHYATQNSMQFEICDILFLEFFSE